MIFLEKRVSRCAGRVVEVRKSRSVAVQDRPSLRCKYEDEEEYEASEW